MLPRVPLKKLSTQMTLAPWARSRSHRCEPRKPEPPVTRMRFSRCIGLPGIIMPRPRTRPAELTLDLIRYETFQLIEIAHLQYRSESAQFGDGDVGSN